VLAQAPWPPCRRTNRPTANSAALKSGRGATRPGCPSRGVEQSCRKPKPQEARTSLSQSYNALKVASSLRWARAGGRGGADQRLGIVLCSGNRGKWDSPKFAERDLRGGLRGGCLFQERLQLHTHSAAQCMGSQSLGTPARWRWESPPRSLVLRVGGCVATPQDQRRRADASASRAVIDRKHHPS